MARPKKLTDAAVAAGLSKLPKWKLKEGKLHREYKFVDFVEAFSFMTNVALLAEGMNHHPEWFNVYNTIRVDLSTHDAGDNLTALDFALAGKMEKLAAQMGQ